MIKKIAWDAFKNTGDINTFLEFKELENVENSINIKEIEQIQKTTDINLKDNNQKM